MDYIIIFTIIFSFLYLVHINRHIFGLIKLPDFKINKNCSFKRSKLYLTIIIPFKNEENNLYNLISSLKNQSLNKSYYEIILINDHSNDNSEKVVKELINEFENIKLISLSKEINGKKNALKEGISHSKTKCIITGDADCIYSSKWLETMLCYYLKYKPKMIIAPVIMKGNSFFRKNQSLEFLSLTGTTAGAVGLKQPTMCNGANLAFEKDIFYEFDDALNSKEISGDDMFLLHNIKKKYPNDIHYLKSNEAVVYTSAEKYFKSFLNQRLRWVSKSKSYRDFDTIYSSVIVLITNLLIVGLAILSIINNIYIVAFISLFSIKILTDFILVYLSAKFFKQKKLLNLYPFLSIIYPLYVCFIAFFGLFARQIRWKGKKNI